jgi:O-antigen biosynthesis protein WbqV
LGEIVELATAANLKVMRLPDQASATMLTSDQLLEPKEIELGDLLGRPEIETDMHGVASMINGRRVLVTGGGGSIGSELCRQIAMLGPKMLIITDNSEFLLYNLDTELRDRHPNLAIVTRILDVRDRGRVNQVFEDHRPEAVFHAAALKHVPLVEENPLEALKTNLLGTRNVADAALATNAASFVMISTDKAVNPTNVMGATKRSAESYCQALDVSSENTRFKTVRFGNVLGSNGSVVPRFKEQIAAGGPVTVTHPDIIRFFMTIPEAVRLVLNASSHALHRKAERGKIMVLDMGKPVRILHLAERMIQLAGFKPHTDIEIVFTGLRPGEKLYEELFDKSEVREETPHDGYFVASPRVIDRMLLNKSVAEVEAAVVREDTERALSILRHIVPEFTPRDGRDDLPGAGPKRIDTSDS